MSASNDKGADHEITRVVFMDRLELGSVVRWDFEGGTVVEWVTVLEVRRDSTRTVAIVDRPSGEQDHISSNNDVPVRIRVEAPVAEPAEGSL